MKKRKLELVLVIMAIALVSLALRTPPSQEEPPPAPVKTMVPVKTSAPLKVQTSKMEMSEDARWVLKTAADSYSPRLKVEKYTVEKPQHP